jgi:hypothetical protein
MGGSKKDFPRLLKQTYDALKPGGWVEFQEFELRLKSDDSTLTECSAITEWELLLDQASKNIGKSLDIIETICANLSKAGYLDCRDDVYKVRLYTLFRERRYLLTPSKVPCWSMAKGSSLQNLGVVLQRTHVARSRGHIFGPVYPRPRMGEREDSCSTSTCHG